MFEKLMIASFAGQNKLEAVESSQVLDCAKLTVTQFRLFDALSVPIRAAPWLYGCVAGGEIRWRGREAGRSGSARSESARTAEEPGKLTGSKRASDTENVDRSMTQVGTRFEAGEEGAWQELGWTRAEG
jgi:hypothetical protein